MTDPDSKDGTPDTPVHELKRKLQLAEPDLWIVNAAPYAARGETGGKRRPRRIGPIIPSRLELFFEQLAVIGLAAAIPWALVILARVVLSALGAWR